VLLRHPIQIYETLFHGLALLLLVLMQKREWFTGHRLKIYLLSYLVFRFFTELIRPEPLVAAGLTAYQIACIVSALGLTLQFLMQSRSASISSRVGS
jgi:prolipoprotein diacylglyceryltransferase